MPCGCGGPLKRPVIKDMASIKKPPVPPFVPRQNLGAYSKFLALDDVGKAVLVSNLDSIKKLNGLQNITTDSILKDCTYCKQLVAGTNWKFLIKNGRRFELVIWQMLNGQCKITSFRPV